MSEYLSSWITKTSTNLTDALATQNKSETPAFVGASKPNLTFTTTYTILYFLLTGLVIYATKTLGFASSSISFLTLALMFSIITVSLSSQSSVFLTLEIISWTAAIEIFDKLGFPVIAWILVFILPIVTIVQSLFYLFFYV